MTIALTFPGQGSQTIGMGKAFFDQFKVAKDVFSEIDEALGQNLSTLFFEGPEELLTLTANAQPALMAVSLAALRVLEYEAGLDLKKHVAFVAGHSLGEYSALAAAGSLTIADTARLLRIRGNAMQAAVAPGVGAMAALLGLDFAAAASVAAEAAQGDVCQAANDNGGGQVVVSGSKYAVERAVELAKAQGARRAVMLAVSAPFHCSLMQPAADAMADALSKVSILAPIVPLVGNVIAMAGADPVAIREALVAQVTGTVRWRESVEWMASQGVKQFIEVGSGKVLTGLVKRIAAETEGLSISNPDDVVLFRSQVVL
jgi:[acyl-carrier-protein] S-malonyltransferase